MTDPRRTHRRGVMVLALSALALGAPASSVAEPIKCQQAILKQSDALARARAKVLRRCEEKKRKGKLAPGTVCATEPAIAGKIAKADAKLAARIAKDCGGKDKACGTGDDDLLASISWPAQCPDFAATGCTQAVVTCADIAGCIGCVQDAAVDRTVTLAYGALVPTNKRQQRKLHKCQGAIGAEVVKLHAALSKPLSQCWRKRYKGKHGNACPDPGDGKAALNIAKARAKLQGKVCKVCGGADKACGGGDDFSPAEIGFAERCPAVGSCGGPVGTLTDLADCLTCVANFGVDCALNLSVPGLASYPPACAGGIPTPTVSPTASATPTPNPSASVTPLVAPSATPTLSTTPVVTSTATATLTNTPSATPTVTPTTTATATSAPVATTSATPSVAASATPTPGATPCAVSSPGVETSLVTVSVTTGQAIGAASMLIDYPADLVRLPSAGGGAAVRARVNDLTNGELFDGGSPNNQDSNADQVPDRLRLSLVSVTGVTGAVLAVELDRCDSAMATLPNDYQCTLADVVGIDGVTPIVDATCAVDLAP